jgi:hypothetical protein
MTEIIYRRGKRPPENPDPHPPEDNQLKASLGNIISEKIAVDVERGVYKRGNRKRGKRRGR